MDTKRQASVPLIWLIRMDNSCSFLFLLFSFMLFYSVFEQNEHEWIRNTWPWGSSWEGPLSMRTHGHKEPGGTQGINEVTIVDTCKKGPWGPLGVPRGSCCCRSSHLLTSYTFLLDRPSACFKKATSKGRTFVMTLPTLLTLRQDAPCFLLVWGNTRDSDAISAWSHSCSIHAPFLQHPCPIYALFMLHSCSIQRPTVMARWNATDSHSRSRGPVKDPGWHLFNIHVSFAPTENVVGTSPSPLLTPFNSCRFKSQMLINSQLNAVPPLLPFSQLQSGIAIHVVLTYNKKWNLKWNLKGNLICSFLGGESLPSN
jgi:hypothetical protein